MFENLFGKPNESMKDRAERELAEIPPIIQLTGFALHAKISRKDETAVNEILKAIRPFIEKEIAIKYYAVLAHALELKVDQLHSMCEKHTLQMIEEMKAMRKINKMDGDH